MTPKPLPLVCDPSLLAEAERIAAQFPTLGYQHCLVMARPPIGPSRLVSSERDARRAESRRAHRQTRVRGAYTGWDR